MKHLYEVIIVDSNTEKIISDKKLIASGREEALITADIKSLLTPTLTLEDISAIVVELGTVKEKEKIQDVRVITTGTSTSASHSIT